MSYPNRLVAQNMYVCGAADGFPPYQYFEKQKPAGLDILLFNKLTSKMEESIKLLQFDWDSVVASLRYGRIDCVIGMEINQKRSKYFDFSTPFYSRKNAIFVLKSNTSIHSLKDLNGKVVLGDRHSHFETVLKNEGVNARLKQTNSKEDSFRLLKNNRYKAVIAPYRVGLYLSKKFNLQLRVVSMEQQGTPVSIAVKKGNQELLLKIEKALKKLQNSGDILLLYKESSIKE